MNCGNGEISKGSKGILIATLLALVALVIFSCDSSPTQSTEDTALYFPGRPGSVWVYQQSVPLTNLFCDTICDSLTRVVFDSLGLSYAEFRESSSQSGSTAYFYQRINSDTVVSYWNSVIRDSGSYPRNMFVLPFDSGDRWADTRLFAVDTYSVVGTEQISEPATGPRKAIRIHRRHHMLNSYLSEDYWFVEGVGIVRDSSIDISLPRVRRLISYRFPRPRIRALSR